MITDNDIQKLKGAFATAEDHTHLEAKVDDLSETVNNLHEDVRTTKAMISQLPTREEISTLLNLSQKLDRVREIIREKLHVEV